MEGERFEKKGQTYFNVKDFFVHFNIGRASIRLDDLFNGDKELGKTTAEKPTSSAILSLNWFEIIINLLQLILFSGDAMNSFLNQNWESIVDEIKPVLEDRISDMFKTFSNNIYHKYPLDMILPPWKISIIWFFNLISNLLYFIDLLFVFFCIELKINNLTLKKCFRIFFFLFFWERNLSKWYKWAFFFKSK